MNYFPEKVNAETNRAKESLNYLDGLVREEIVELIVV